MFSDADRRLATRFDRESDANWERGLCAAQHNCGAKSMCCQQCRQNGGWQPPRVAAGLLAGNSPRHPLLPDIRVVTDRPNLASACQTHPMRRNFDSGLRVSAGKDALIPLMEEHPQSQSDKCSRCQVLLEITSVKIGLSRVTMRSSCPNCGMVQTQTPNKKDRPKQPRRGPMSFLRKRS
jgi:hypothetical protein